MTSAYDPVQQTFENVIRDFKSSLNDDALYKEILKTTSIDQVYDLTDKLQEEQAKKGHLRHLSKIQPYLEGLDSYAGVIEVFMQIKPDILALIWGPIKLLIQWASVLKQSFDAIINTTADIGVLLPEFREVAKLFDQNERIKDVLVLFFKDILDFYLIALKFFSKPRWKYFFESFWPRLNSKIKVVADHIKRITLLLRNEVQMEHIQAEHRERLRALEHFERTEKFHQRQEFEIIKADISPKNYEDAIYHLRHRVLVGTGKWLVRDPQFIKWLDVSENLTRLLWLQGIPGAGKTYLSSTVVETVKSHGRAIFAFLSHNFRSTTTALSILHSFIFQLASESDDLQEVLCQSTRENLKWNIDTATSLIKTLLACAGPVYIIVDGLDEINESERGIVITKLVHLSETCEDTRIFLSSRSEADISAVLEGKAAKIRVDHHNSGSIQTFVDAHIQKWFIDRDFLPEARVEIEKLLAPLAANSKGMFLYAKVVLSDITDLDVYEILSELQILPESLDDVYSRVLARVNGLKPPLLKEKARKLLGWIGNSPTPLTIHEMEQALIINPDDLEGNVKVLASLNVVKICGSIVEVVDDYVQFVHFTVKEYLFSPRISGFINGTEATISLAICCVTYLCQHHHDQGIGDQEICHHLLSGAYRLHNFATAMWFDLVEYVATLSSQSLPDTLANLLRLLSTERRNESYEGAPSTYSSACFKKYPEIHEMASKQAEFRRACSNGGFDKRHGGMWVDLDPLTISNTLVHIYMEFDRLWQTTTNPDNLHYRSTIQRHYGKRPFKCGFLGCSLHRHGFETRSARDSHMKHHDRPWKCSFPGCEFEKGGFLSRKMRDDHLGRFHQKTKIANNTALENLDTDDVQPLLFDLVRANNTEQLKILLPRIPELNLSVQDKLRELAVSVGSSQTVGIILDHTYDRFIRLSHLASNCAKAGNIEAFETLLLGLNSTKSGRYIFNRAEEFLPAVLQSDSDEFYEKWVKHINFEENRRNPLKIPPPSSCFLSSDVIRTTALQPQREKFLLSVWKKADLIASCGVRYIGDGLVGVASTTCSLRLAKFLLDCGAAVDHRRSPTYRTPLHHAATQKSAEAAQLMRLLLQRGADPEVTAGGEPPKGTRYARSSRASITLRDVTKIRDEKGVKEISKWLGMSWDELLIYVQEQKQKRETDESKVEECLD